MPNDTEISLIGFASGLAGGLPGAAFGPAQLLSTHALDLLKNKQIKIIWKDLIQSLPESTLDKTHEIVYLCKKLSISVKSQVEAGQLFGVLGGDHSCAMGTWSGAASALKSFNPEQALGLIWVDAHMDSHTFETSLSGNIHGMPLAALLGHGLPELTTIAEFAPALTPANVCLIGVRSFELEEDALLKKLGVRVFFMEEVLNRGLSAVMREARQIVTVGANRYGISIDIDSMDPIDAPGTGVCEPGGIPAAHLIEALGMFAGDTRFLGFEIAEFDPTLDRQEKTQKIIPNLIAAMTVGSDRHE